MKPIDDIRLKKRLIEAFHANPDIDINPGWQQDTMRKIRGIGPQKQDMPPVLSFQAMVWKLAPAFCILLVVLITGIFSLDLSIETLVSESFIDDPVNVIYNGIFWG